MRAKSEVFEHLKAFITCAELETGNRVVALHSDGGGEYTANTVQEYLREKGIKHKLTTPDMPQHNGVTERMNRTLLDKVRAMLIDAELPESYWFDALRYTAHIHNVTPTCALENIMPEEAWSGNKPNVPDLRVFGSRAFVHIPESQRKKLESCSLICRFIGLARQRRAYCLVHCESRQFFESRDVIFDEGGTTKCYEHLTIEHNNAKDTTQAQVLAPAQAQAPAPPTQTQVPQPQPSPIVVDQSCTPAPAAALLRPKRNARTPIRDDDPRFSVSSYGPRTRSERASLAHIDTMPDPKTYAEAMARPDADMWDAACEEEKRSFEVMGIYNVVPRLENRKVLGSKWVLRIKHGPDGTIQKYKARVVAQGFTQIEGVDYDKTFAPVAKLASLCAVLALATELNWEVHQMDVKAAYLNGELEEEIYMAPPPGFDIPEGMVLKLKKALYSTKQGGRVWYKNVKAELEDMGYTRTEADHAVFVRFRNGVVSIILLYVDDFTMTCRDIKVIEKDKEALMETYDMTDLGEISYILGIHIKRDREAGQMELLQQKQIEEILERFGKTGVRPINTPALANEHLHKLDSPEIDAKSYQRALGTIMYPMLGT